MSSHKCDWTQFRPFFQALTRSGPVGKLFFEVRCLPRKGAAHKVRRVWMTTGSKPDWPAIERWNASGYGIYLGPNLRREKQGRRKDVAEVRALYADLDVQSAQHPNSKHATKRAAFLALAERLPRSLFPSAIVDTGWGLQAHWFLRPLAVTNGVGARVEELLTRLATLLDGDPTTEINRVMRLPGSWNMKEPRKPRPVRLVHLAADRRFSLDGFAAIRATEETEDSQTADQHAAPDWVTELLQGVAMGDRHDAAKRLAAHFLGTRMSPAHTSAILRNWAHRCRPPWTEDGADKELSDLVNWVMEQEAEKLGTPPGPDAEDSAMQNYIDGIRAQTKVLMYLRRRHIAMVVLNDLTSRGRFLLSNEGPAFFRRDRRRMIPILPSGEGLGGVLRRHGLNPTETEFRYVAQYLRTTAEEQGEPCSISRMARYDTEAQVLYLSQFDGRILRLDGQEITEMENGQGGVYFRDEPDWLPWQPDLAAPPGRLDELLVAPINFAGGHIAVDEVRCLWSLWLRGLFFSEWMLTKPLCLLTGPKGAGKTTAFRAVLTALLGPKADVLALEGSQRGEEGFLAAVTANRLAAFDNADAKIPWLEDHLARLSTGGEIIRRQLYTTNEAVRYRPMIFIGLTARTPKFRREDVAERTLVLPVEELAEKIPERNSWDGCSGQGGLSGGNWCATSTGS